LGIAFDSRSPIRLGFGCGPRQRGIRRGFGYVDPHSFGLRLATVDRPMMIETGFCHRHVQVRAPVSLVVLDEVAPRGRSGIGPFRALSTLRRLPAWGELSSRSAFHDAYAG